MSPEGSRSENRGAGGGKHRWGGRSPSGGGRHQEDGALLEGVKQRQERSPYGGRRHQRKGSRNRSSDERDSKRDERGSRQCQDGEFSRDPTSQLLTAPPQARQRKISIGKRGSAVLKAFLPEILQKSPPRSPMLSTGSPLLPSREETSQRSPEASQRSSPPLHHSPTPPSLSTTTSSPTTPPSLSTPPSLESLRSGLRSDCESSSLSRLALANSLFDHQVEEISNETSGQGALRGLSHSNSDTTCELKSAR